MKALVRLLLVSVLIAGCGGALTETAPPPPPEAPTHTPIPPTPTQTISFLPNDYPPLPTATLGVDSDSSRPGDFHNSEFGVALRYPQLWPPVDVSNAQNGELLWVYSPDDQISVILFYTLWADQGLEGASHAIVDSSFSALKNLETLSDGAVTLESGAEAWQTVLTAEFDDGSPLKASMTTLLGGGRTFSVMASGNPTDFDSYQSEIDSIVHSLNYTGESLYGLPRSQSLVLVGYETDNPREYDPATQHSGGDGLVFTGLVSFDPQLNLVPELAESWTLSDDGTVYTFKIRDARFHNGRPVTAQDVVYSWERAAHPATESETVLTYLGDIVGVKEMRDATADHISGLAVLDDHTLQVTIDAPKPYFLLKLTYPTGHVESGPEWYRTPNGTGPYKLIRWDSMQLIVYERNEDYYFGPPPIRFVINKLFAGSPLRLYESNEIDMAGVGRFDLARFQNPAEPMSAELHSGVNLCTGYIHFDNDQPPFDDVKVRQAFSLAFNRQKYIDVLYNGIAIPAEGIYPPALPGHNLNLDGLPFDPDRARQLLVESTYGGPETLPPIVYTTGGLGSSSGGSVAALAQMWEQALGVTISIENLDPDHFYDEIFAGRHGQIFDGGWCADYPDPENFADALFHTGAQQNESHYSNPELDALLEAARVETDVTKRIAVYQQAEQIIVNDAPVIFTTHSQSFMLVKPHIQGFVMTPFGVPLTRFLSIDPSKLK